MPYQNFLPATCLSDHCFCELPRWESIIRQPSNSVTGAIFCLVAVGLIMKGPQVGSRWYANRSFYHIYLFSLIFLGLGTMAFHASLTWVGQWSDGMGLYMVISTLQLVAIARVSPVIDKHPWPSFILLISLGGGLSLSFPLLRLWIFAFLVLVCFFTVMLGKKNHWLNWNSQLFRRIIIFFGGGLALQILDNSRLICWPSSWFQLHAIWHIMAGLATIEIFRLLNADNVKP